MEEGAKDSIFFSHDANARHDPKILEMRSLYGAEGYGWYWIIVEMLREQKDYRLKWKGQYVCNALAMQMQCSPDTAYKFVDDCINHFNLFQSDGDFFWSDSLIRRMKWKDTKSEKARQAALSRWGKKKDADALQGECQGNTRKGKESKLKESKLKERKVKYGDFVSMTPEEYQKLVIKFGEEETKAMIDILDNYKGANGKNYKSDYRAILSWVVNRYQEEREKGVIVRENTKGYPEAVGRKDMAGKYRQFVSN